MIGDLLAALVIYGIYSGLWLIGTALWVLVGEATIEVRHYVTGKLLGLILVGWLAWWGSSLHWAPFNYPPYLWTLTLSLSAAAMLVFWIAGFSPGGGGWRQWVLCILRFELVSLAVFLLYLYLRGFHPQLESTEKYMDLAMLSAAGRTEHFPFLDFWRSDLPVNYYYYGYVLLALLLNLAGIAAPLGYNILLGLILVLSLQLVYLLVVQITGSRFAGVLGAVLLGVAGNFHFAGCYLSNLWNRGSISSACFYPKATRIYENSFTINEIPSYSFLLGDLHPHLISVPFFLLNLLILWRLKETPRTSWRLMSLVVFTLATNAIVHVWDLMTLGSFLFLMLAAGIGAEYVRAQSGYRWAPGRAAIPAFVLLAAAAVAPFVLFWPFFNHFESPVAGLGFAPAFVQMADLVGAAQYPSAPSFLMGLWGTFWLPIAMSLIILWPHWTTSGPGILFAILITVLALFLITFTELFFFQDFFHVTGPEHFRTNTVFKLGYHAWLLFAVATAILVHGAWKLAGRQEPAAQRILLFSCVLVFSAALIFPVEGVRQVFGPLPPWDLQGRVLTLDGSRFIANKNMADWATIKWLRRHVPGRPVLLEATGNSYSYAGRMGVFSGLINPINWIFHQWTWRFAYPDGVTDWHDIRAQVGDTGIDAIRAIESDVKILYETPERDVAISLARKYRIEYIYIGDLERNTYPQLNKILLLSLGKTVFTSGDSLLIKVDYDESI